MINKIYSYCPTCTIDHYQHCCYGCIMFDICSSPISNNICTYYNHCKYVKARKEFDGRPLCPTCGKNVANEPKICPYNYEIYNDDETLCTCCDECRQDCIDDI